MYSQYTTFSVVLTNASHTRTQNARIPLAGWPAAPEHAARSSDDSASNQRADYDAHVLTTINNVGDHILHANGASSLVFT